MIDSGTLIAALAGAGITILTTVIAQGMLLLGNNWIAAKKELRERVQSRTKMRTVLKVELNIFYQWLGKIEPDLRPPRIVTSPLTEVQPMPDVRFVLSAIEAFAELTPEELRQLAAFQANLRAMAILWSSLQQGHSIPAVELRPKGQSVFFSLVKLAHLLDDGLDADGTNTDEWRPDREEYLKDNREEAST